MPTKIEWTDETINPIVGCSKISPACDNCYAEKMARRLITMPKIAERYKGTVDKNGWTGQLNFVPSELEKPARWKKPRRIFVGSMTDIFHEKSMFSWRMGILKMVKDNPRHTFIFLTKRPERMKGFLDMYERIWRIPENLWLGVTAENQETFDQRVPVLLSIPAAVHFVSVEPMLSRITATPMIGYNAYKCKCGWHDTEHNLFLMGATEKNRIAKCKTCHEKAEIYRAVNWIICGSETGTVKRLMPISWVHDLRNQCKDADIPFFFKKDSNGTIPDDLNIREFPK